MSDEILKRDQNHVTVLAGVTDDSDKDIVMLRIDPITKRLLVTIENLPSGGNSFQTINTPFGTDPVADSATDTLNYTSTGGALIITGDAATKTIDFNSSRTGVYRDFPVHSQAIPLGDSGSERATLNLTNGAYIETIAMAGGESLVFNWTAPETIESNSKMYVEYYWSPATGASVSDTLRFGTSILTIGDNEDLNGTFPTDITVDEAVQTANREFQHISPATENTTTVSPGDTVLFRLTRSAVGTMAEDCYLHKIRIQYLESRTEPSALS